MRFSPRPATEITLGERCTVEAGAVLTTQWGGKIEIGDRCHIGHHNFLSGSGEGLTIGDDALLGPHVTIVPSEHIFDDREELIINQGITSRGVRIGNDVWIAAHASILDGVTVGRGAVIAAGAVVKHDVAPFEVVGGVPARHLRWRGDREPPAPRPWDGTAFRPSFLEMGRRRRR